MLLLFTSAGCPFFNSPPSSPIMSLSCAEQPEREVVIMPEGLGKLLEGIKDSVKRRDGGKLVKTCRADLRTALWQPVASVVA